MFTLIAVVGLAAIWGTAFNFAQRDLAAAEREARTLVADQTDTYEAQMVRALREIDQGLRLIRHQLRSASPEATLGTLSDEGLLPPEFLFTFSILDANGNVLATTGSLQDLHGDVLASARDSESLVISPPWEGASGDEWRVRFALPRDDDDGNFAGIATASVHAGYFVSGYETALLGDKGVLGLVGGDGVFRARRSGDVVSAGSRIDYGNLFGTNADGDAPASLAVNSWDGIERYIVTREVFGYPAGIVVGVSRSEQLTAAHQLRRTYFIRAGVASVLLIGVLGLLGRLTWQLQRERRNALEERIAHAQHSEYIAFHDSLTSLPNRALFTRLLTQNIEYAKRHGHCLALLFLDLDRFKAINDSLGHDAGDELLQEIGNRLNASVRNSDTVARLGGDEFVVLLPRVSSASDVGPIANKILAAVAKPFTLAGQDFRVTVSIGVTVFPTDGEDEQTLMKNADMAMYHAKEQGKNNFQCYSKELSADTLERLALESSLRQALQRDEFRLFYQAKRSLATDQVTGMEALLRWQHPELGLIAPMQFIPLAEETGLIVPIGRWVLRTACQQNEEWQAQGFPPLPMAVNLSARQFLDENLLADIKGALRDSGMDPRLLEVEITESMIMSDVPHTQRILEALQEMGVRVAIDDFGTGYSSLSTLKQFPIDSVKMDRPPRSGRR